MSPVKVGLCNFPRNVFAHLHVCICIYTRVNQRKRQFSHNIVISTQEEELYISLFHIRSLYGSEHMWKSTFGIVQSVFVPHPRRFSVALEAMPHSLLGLVYWPKLTTKQCLRQRVEDVVIRWLRIYQFIRPALSLSTSTTLKQNSSPPCF